MFRFLILIFFSLFSLSSIALKSVNLVDGVGEYFIEESTEYLEDPTSTLSFEDVKNSQGFTHTSKKGLNFGYTDSTYWVRFKILNISKQDRWFLEITYPPLDYVDYYMPVKNGYKHYESGDLRSETGE